MEFESEQCLDDLLMARAAHLPDRPAITAPGRDALTYAALYAQTIETIRALNRAGVGRREVGGDGAADRVAIVLPNGPEMATAFLGVAAGGAAAPLNPAYREEEFDFYLGDLQARALIVLAEQDNPARRAAAKRGIPILELCPAPGGPAGSFALQGGQAAIPLATGPGSPVDTALVLHTSGTTSRPKMVPLTGRNLCASAHHIRKTLALTIDDCCLNVMPLFHIHGLVAALLATLAAGGSVCCTPGFQAGRFFEWIDAARPTWYTAVPTMHQAVLAEASKNRTVIAGNRLRFVRSSSASLPPQVMAELESVFDAPVIEAYGMTEAAHQMASNPLPPYPRKPGSVGMAAGPEICILDQQGQALAAGQPGEICIRGLNITPGYLSNPQANASAFTADGWFRTGDQGYLDDEGYLFITGRLKEMINRGGEKVAPREVDEVLLDHPAVAQAVTFGVRHPTLGEDVAAAVTLRPGASVTPRELRRFVLSRLAAHKAPSHIIFLDEIPKGPTGKLQRIGLGERLMNRLQADYTAPRSEIEEVLAGLWAETLRRDPLSAPVGVNDNFFLSGGDSLLATALIARIRAAFEIDLPLGSIFREPTVAEQAILVEDLLLDQLEASGDDRESPISRTEGGA